MAINSLCAKTINSGLKMRKLQGRARHLPLSQPIRNKTKSLARVGVKWMIVGRVCIYVIKVNMVTENTSIN